MWSRGEFTELQAFSFKTALSLPDILARVQADGVRLWGNGSSDSLGDYVGSHTRSTIDRDDPTFVETRLKFFLEDDRCILDILFESRLPTAVEDWRGLSEYVHERLLPLVEARDIQETHDYSS